MHSPPSRLRKTKTNHAKAIDQLFANHVATNTRRYPPTYTRIYNNRPMVSITIPARAHPSSHLFARRSCPAKTCSNSRALRVRLLIFFRSYYQIYDFLLSLSQIFLLSDIHLSMRASKISIALLCAAL